MKKMLFILMMIAAIYGCGMEEKEEEAVMTNQTADEFQKLMDEEQAGDKLAVNWDGVKAEVIEDPWDDIEISDGRGDYVYESIEKEGWNVKLIGERQYRILMDEEEQYVARGDDWELEIRKINLEEVLESLSEDQWMQAVTKKDLNQQIADRNENAALYRGLKETEDGVKAGYILALEDSWGNDWMLSYFGCGNMNDVKSAAMTIFKSFRSKRFRQNTI